MSDDFKQPGQWASGTAIAQASDGATAIVYSGPSMGDIIQAVSAAMSDAGAGFSRLSVAIPQLIANPPTAPELPLTRKNLLGRLKQKLESEHVAVLRGDVGSGRSELARNYAETLERVFWLDLEANAQLTPSLALELFLQNLSSVSEPQTTSTLPYDSVPASSVLVIENVSQAVNDAGFLQPGAMAQFADGLGKAKEAYEWAIEAAELGSTASNNSSAEHFLTQAIPFDIHEKRYTLALEHAIRAARGFASRQPLALSEEVRAERQQEGISEPGPISNDFSRFGPITLGLIPVVLDVAAGTEQNPAFAQEALPSILDICRTQRESSDDPLMWEIAIDALERGTNAAFSISALPKANPEWSAWHKEEHQILWTYAAVIGGNSSPRDLWLAQGKIARWISGFYRHLGNLGGVVSGSIAQMWLGRITRSAYLFRLPQYAAKRIKEAAEQAHLGQILLAVSESLGLNLSDEYRKVLSECTLKRSD